MNRIWCIALAFGDVKECCLVLSAHISPSAETATAITTSQFYIDNPDKRLLPLAGMASLEITREHMEMFLRQAHENEAKPTPIVQLVPKPDPEQIPWSLWTDEMIARHFWGQRKTMSEIEAIVGRKIDWNAIGKGDPAA